MARSSPAQRPLLAALALVITGLPSLALAQSSWSDSASGVSLPALPPATGVDRPALQPLLPRPAAQGQPLLQSQASCPILQQRIASLVAGESSVWSISVADGQGRLLADINGNRPRVPASNQKLISSAFALDRLGPDHRLSTRLWRLSDGTLRLTGQGDPDLALPQLQRFAKLAVASGSNGAGPARINLQLAEEASSNWWPSGWHYGDRSAAYGAPITRLAITSNAIDDAVMNPAGRLQALMKRSLDQQSGSQGQGQIQLSMVSARQPLPGDAVLLHEEPSTGMHGLLSLANTESHNFTAEVLLRTAADSWDVDEASRRQTAWLQQQGLPLEGVRIRDGSGLDRANRVTSHFLTALLVRMAQHPYGRYYFGSMAIAGRRGTLRNLYKGTSLDGQVQAKTGTLTGVRAISGLLNTSDGPRYFSAISNGAGSPNQTIGAVLRQVQDPSLCGGPVSSSRALTY